VACRLHAAQQDDFPITVRRGFSLSNLIIAPEPILYTGLDAPDVLVIYSLDGLQRLGDLSRIPSSALIVAPTHLPLGGTSATVRCFDMRALEKRVGPMSVALAALTLALIQSGLMDSTALEKAAEAIVAGPYRAANLAAIAAGTELALRQDPPLELAAL
jgi:Pyruvate/2-oxoacid:ferredoxin oxidoreductase gamma subunit